MRTNVASGLVVGALALALSGCGFFDDGGEPREAWRGQAEARCVADGIVRASAFAEDIGRVDGPGSCGIDKGFRVAAVQQGAVQIQPAPRINCPQAAAVDRWTREIVQPAAHAHFGMPVVAMKNAASYGCRTRNHKRGAKLSEHSFGNALDISAFTLADGRTFTLLEGWRGEPAQRAFLREVASGACGIFRTVLGPGSDGKHEDHFHLDLARHDAKFQRTYCRPRPEPRPTPSFGAPDGTPMVEAPAASDPYAVDVPMSYAPLERPARMGLGGKSRPITIGDLLRN